VICQRKSDIKGNPFVCD